MKRGASWVAAGTYGPISPVVPIVVAIVAGSLAVALLVAHLTGHTKWMRNLDERMYESKVGLLVPGGWLYRLGKSRGGDGRDWPFFVGGLAGWSAYELGRRQNQPSQPPPGRPPRPLSGEDLPDGGEIVPVTGPGHSSE